MLISVLIPCKNRTHDLKRTMPSIIKASEKSPPVELVVVNYGSDDDLDDYIKELNQPIVSYHKFDYPYYNISHAWNLSAKLSKGDWLVVLGTDIYLDENYFDTVRENAGYTWMHDLPLKGVLAIRRSEFMDSGGYDERISNYGPEDKDFEARLKRRGGRLKILPNGLIKEIYTPVEDKLANYPPGERKEIKKRQHQILYDNISSGVLVANKGKQWGQP